jgi:hypothetical protein
LHWTGADYERVFPAYHFCLAGAAEIVVHATHDLCANMRDVRADPGLPYAAHTANRNSFAIGIAACGMADALPGAFGPAPLTKAQCAGLIRVSARLAAHYAIPLAAIRTHAEAACEDGYFGAGEDERWDIARIAPSPAPLEPREAAATGDWFRTRIAGELERLNRGGIDPA